MTTTEIFKFYKNSTVFNAQNAGNCISRGKDPGSPFSGHSRLLHLQWPLITKVTDTPAVVFS